MDNTAKIQEIEAALDKINAERAKLRAEGRRLMELRARLIAEDNAAAHGLTVTEYAEAKASYDPKTGPLARHLGRFRRAARDVQGATAEAAQVGVKGAK